VGSSRKAIQTREDAGKVIPQAIQEPIRERLRLLRLSRGRTISDNDPEVSLISNGVISTYELHDI
jgi:hypothetical protein